MKPYRLFAAVVFCTFSLSVQAADIYPNGYFKKPVRARSGKKLPEPRLTRDDRLREARLQEAAVKSSAEPKGMVPTAAPAPAPAANPELAELDRIIARSPKSAVAYLRRANVYNKLKQPQKALEDYNQAIRLDPMQLSAYTGRAAAYAALGDTQKAEQDRRRAEVLRWSY